MNLIQHAQFIASKVGLPDNATVAKIKGYLAHRYQNIWELALWRDALTLYTPSVTAGTSYLTLQDEAENVPAVAWDRRALFPSDEALQFNRRLEALFDDGDPAEVADVGRLGVKGDPASSVLELLSDSASDTAVQVTLLGQKDGIEYREVLTLTGTTPVATSNGYDLVRAFSRTVGFGTVSCRRLSDSVVIGNLGRLDVERQHVRLRLMPKAIAAGTLLVLAKRRMHPLRDDSDVMVLRGAEMAAQAFAHGDTLEWMRQYAKAQVKFSEAQTLLDVALKNDVWQTSRLQQIVPADGVGTQLPWHTCR